MESLNESLSICAQGIIKREESENSAREQCEYKSKMYKINTENNRQVAS